MLRLLIFLGCTGLLLARENPFEPVITPQESGKVQEIAKPNYFNREILSLPSTARKIRKIELQYQNMDGSLDSVELETERDIDWHFPIVILQDKDGTFQQAQKKSSFVKAEIMSQTPQKLPSATQPMTPSNKKEFKPLDFITFELNGKTLIIHTKDMKIRDFALSEPTKIVLDFKRDTTFYTKKVLTDTLYFSEIALGNHNGYYRTAIMLDGQYRYTLSEIQGGFKIELE